MAMPGLLHAQGESIPSSVEFGIGTWGLGVLTSGVPSSINGSVPCSNTYGSSMQLNPGGTLWAGFLFDPTSTAGLRVSALTLSVGYSDLSSQFKAFPTQNLDAYDYTSERFVAVQTEERAIYTLHYLHSSLTLGIGIGKSARVIAGPSFDIPLAGSSREEEEILSPANATFLDKTQLRTIREGTGTLSDLKSRVGIYGGVAYRLPVGETLFIEPQIGVDYGITEVQPGWSPTTIRGGISLGYHGSRAPEAPPPPPVETKPEPAPVAAEKPAEPAFAPVMSISVFAERGSIPFKRQIVARYIPLLPIVFFDRNASTIADRYNQHPANGANMFNEGDLSGNAEETQHQTLNIIGERMRRNRNVRLTVNGTTSRDEDDRAALARSRAESIASYLETVWGIDQGRITIHSQIQPDVPSNSDYPEGLEENRRVELELSPDAAYNPVQLRSVEPVTDPKDITFHTTSQSTVPIAQWNVRLSSGEEMLDNISGEGTPPTQISWNLTQEKREQILRSGRIDYILSATGPNGAVVSTPQQQIPLQLDTTITVSSSPERPDNSADFLLVTFDFNSADLTRRGREDLKAISDRIGPKSEVSIVGFTDVLGDGTRNKALAEQRAKQVADQLPKGETITYRGATPEEAPYDNHYPEGRFLSRTVRVVVKNPK